MLEPGLRATAGSKVTDADTAVAVGSGDVPVLATPRLIALCEAATVAAVAGHLADDETSVGTRVEIDHLAPSPVGAAVEATAVLEAVDGHLLHFTVTVSGGGRVVARGAVHRAVMNRHTFLDRIGGSP